jgi:hypothetical protein
MRWVCADLNHINQIEYHQKDIIIRSYDRQDKSLRTKSSLTQSSKAIRFQVCFFVRACLKIPSWAQFLCQAPFLILE